MQMSQVRPENPAIGDSFLDINTRTLNVFDGTVWQEFSEYELIEMEMMSLLMGTGRTQEEAAHMINILQHGHMHNEIHI